MFQKRNTTATKKLSKAEKKVQKATIKNRQKNERHAVKSLYKIAPTGGLRYILRHVFVRDTTKQPFWKELIKVIGLGLFLGLSVIGFDWCLSQTVSWINSNDYMTELLPNDIIQISYASIATFTCLLSLLISLFVFMTPVAEQRAIGTVSTHGLRKQTKSLYRNIWCVMLLLFLLQVIAMLLWT